MTDLTAAAAAGARLTALEPLDAPAGVDQLLPAGVEGVAVRADLHVQLGLGRACRELVPARAAHVGLYVLRVDLGLHLLIESSDLSWKFGFSFPSGWAWLRAHVG